MAQEPPKSGPTRKQALKPLLPVLVGVADLIRLWLFTSGALREESGFLVSGRFLANRIQVRIEARNALRKINGEVVSPTSESLPDFEIPAGDQELPPR